MHCLAQWAAASSATAPAIRALRWRSASCPSSLQAAAASQATAAHCSTATSMSASACLTAWNWPIGRPNCTRTLAYSDAVSRHQRAIPALSAATRSRARPRTSASGTRSDPAGTTRPVAVDLERPERPGGVEGRERLDRHPVAQVLAVEQAPPHAVGAPVQRHEDEPSRGQARDGTHGTGQLRRTPSPGNEAGGAERHGRRDRAVGQAGQQRGPRRLVRRGGTRPSTRGVSGGRGRGRGRGPAPRGPRPPRPA